MTKGGEFVTGHDARHKSNLIKEAKADNADALAELERRNWTKFLDKSREADARRGERAQRQARGERVVRVNADGETPEQVAKVRLANFERMKQAGRYLQAINRYGQSAGERRISLSDPVAVEGILTNSHPDFTDSDTEIIALIIKAGH